MTERFYRFVNFANESIGAFGLFLLSGALISIMFILVFILSLSVRNYSFSKRRWFILSSIAVCVLQYAFMINQTDKIFLLFLISLILFYCAIIFSIRVRKKVDKGQKELINYIDSQVRKANSINFEDVPHKRAVHDTESCLMCEKGLLESSVKSHLSKLGAEKCEQAKTDKTADLDFSHVKSVIAKLSYFNLSQNDRKQIKDLENIILLAESNEYYPDLNSKINDGLGMLLKIMAKYGA